MLLYYLHYLFQNVSFEEINDFHFIKANKYYNDFEEIKYRDNYISPFIYSILFPSDIKKIEFYLQYETSMTYATNN